MNQKIQKSLSGINVNHLTNKISESITSDVQLNGSANLYINHNNTNIESYYANDMKSPKIKNVSNSKNSLSNTSKVENSVKKHILAAQMKKTEKRSKKLDEMLKINIDPGIINRSSTNKSFNIDFSNNVLQSPSYSPATTRTKRYKMPEDIIINNSKMTKTMSHDLEYLKAKELIRLSVQKVLMKDFLKKDSNRDNKKISQPRSDDRTNIGSMNEIKLNPQQKIDKDLSISEKLRAHRIHTSQNIQCRDSKHLTNSPNSSIIANIRMSSRDNKLVYYNLVPLHTPKASYSSLNEILIEDKNRKNEHQEYSLDPKSIEGKHKTEFFGEALPEDHEIIYLQNKLLDINSLISTSAKTPAAKQMKHYQPLKNLANNSANSSLNYSNGFLKNTINGSFKANNLNSSKEQNLDNNNSSVAQGNMLKKSENLDICQKEEKSPKNIDEIIKTLQIKNECGAEILNNIRDEFDMMLDQDLMHLINSQQNLIMMKKLKQAYEKYIENLKKSIVSEDKKKLIEENNHLKEENSSLMRKNIILQSNLDEALKDHPHCCVSSSCKNNNKRPLSPIKVAINVDKKQQQQQQMDIDTPPITNNTDKSQKDCLKQIIINQQNTIKILKKKEAKMIRLLHAIKKQGLDIEKIYYQEVKGIYDGSDDGSNSLGTANCQSKTNEEHNLPTIEKAKHNHDSANSKAENLQSNPDHRTKTIESTEKQEPGDHESSIKEENKGKESFLDSENPSSDDMAYVRHHRNISDLRSMNPDQQNLANSNLSNTHTSLSPSHINLKPELKNKLKLDLTTLKSPLSCSTSINQNPLKSNIASNMNSKNYNEEDMPIGFHEEFMSKLEEFSLSWRQAALNERKL